MTFKVYNKRISMIPNCLENLPLPVMKSMEYQTKHNQNSRANQDPSCNGSDKKIKWKVFPTSELTGLVIYIEKCIPLITICYLN
jgi:hypothetical protein